MGNLDQDKLKSLAEGLRSDYARRVNEVREELLRSGEQHFVDLAGRVADMGELSVADALADLDAAIIDRHVREMREIEAALARMDSGDYGSCIECGADIDYARLQAFPAAARCIACQTRHEKEFAHPNHPSL